VRRLLALWCENSNAKRHPHVDLTLNGWRGVDGKASTVKEYWLGKGGLHRWNETVRRAAGAVWPGAKSGNVRLKRVRVGFQDYAAVLRYQVRELVDLRKLDYDRGKQTVAWLSYDSAHRAAAPNGVHGGRVHGRPAGVPGPARVLAQRHPPSLHSRYGHMADRTRNRTAAAIGGRPRRHRENCPCMECGREWHRVFLTDDGEIRGYARDLVPPRGY
jgi:hypothetical protein